MPDSSNFAKLVPGFDFLQGLVKNAGAALPSIGQWIAPTLDPTELQRRIDELRTVQFWLDQNAKMLGTTIQALEVQRMTLSTLQGMNVPMADLRDAMKAAPANPMAAMGVPAQAAADSMAQGAEALMKAAQSAMGGLGGLPAFGKAPAPAPAPSPTPSPTPSPAAKPAATATPPAAAAGLVDPMQWWGALTQQFTQLASSALKDSAADAAKMFGDAAKAWPGAATGPAVKTAKAAAPTSAAAAAPAPVTPAARPARAKPAAKSATRPRAAKTTGVSRRG